MFGEQDELSRLLERSDELELHLRTILDDRNQFEAPRRNVSRVMCSLAREHAQSCRILIARLNLTSALGLIRLQYESIVRALWVGYVAKNSFISKMTADLSPDSARKASKMPMLAEMLAELEKAASIGEAPLQPIEELKEMKEHGWKPLSSIVHTGIHAIHRHKLGYPQPMIEQLLKISNGMLVITAYLMAVLSDNAHWMKNMNKYQAAFADCLPPERS